MVSPKGKSTLPGDLSVEGKPGYLFLLSLLALVALIGAFLRLGDKIALLGQAPSVETREAAQTVFASFSINGRPLRVEIARTADEHYQGLSDRTSLCPACGMLFLFSDSEPRTFVMRHMKFPLDMVWLSAGKVVAIDANLPPESAEPYTPYGPAMPVDAVIELNAGAAQAYGIEIGQTITLPT